MLFSPNLLRSLRILFWVSVPVILLLIPADSFDNGPVMCVSRWWLGIECLGCGLTRGVMHLIHFDWAAAWGFNKMSFIATPLLAFLWIKWAMKDVQYIVDTN